MPVVLGDESTGTDPIYFSTAEDMILAKLAWFRAGGEVSERPYNPQKIANPASSPMKLTSVSGRPMRTKSLNL